MSQSRYVLISIVLAFMAGCGTGPASAPATAATNNVASPPITDEECIAYARKLEALIVAGDARGATAMIDWEGMVDEGLNGLSDEKAAPFLAGLREGFLRSSHKTFETIADQSKDGGSYRFLRVRSGAEGKRALFRRLGSNNSGLNYHEILLIRKDGKCIGHDIYVYTSGERQSHLLRRMAILGASEKAPSILQKLNGVESEDVKHAAASAAMFKAMKADRYADALAAYARLSPSLQREKPYLLTRIRAAQQVSKEETIAALATFREVYPDDPAADLHLVHSLMLREDFVAARKALDHIEKSVGGDPFIDVWRAQFFLKEGKHAEADEAAQKAIAADRTLKDAWWVRVTVALKTRNFARTVELLTVLEKENGQEPADVTSPLFADFLKSPEYQKWMESKR